MSLCFSALSHAFFGLLVCVYARVRLLPMRRLRSARSVETRDYTDSIVRQYRVGETHVRDTCDALPYDFSIPNFVHAISRHARRGKGRDLRNINVPPIIYFVLLYRGSLIVVTEKTCVTAKIAIDLVCLVIAARDKHVVTFSLSLSLSCNRVTSIKDTFAAIPYARNYDTISLIRSFIRFASVIA